MDITIHKEAQAWGKDAKAIQCGFHWASWEAMGVASFAWGSL